MLFIMSFSFAGLWLRIRCGGGETYRMSCGFQDVVDRCWATVGMNALVCDLSKFSQANYWVPSELSLYEMPISDYI